MKETRRFKIIYAVIVWGTYLVGGFTLGFAAFMCFEEEAWISAFIASVMFVLVAVLALSSQTLEKGYWDGEY